MKFLKVLSTLMQIGLVVLLLYSIKKVGVDGDILNLDHWLALAVFSIITLCIGRLFISSRLLELPLSLYLPNVIILVFISGLPLYVALSGWPKMPICFLDAFYLGCAVLSPFFLLEKRKNEEKEKEKPTDSPVKDE